MSLSFLCIFRRPAGAVAPREESSSDVPRSVSRWLDAHRVDLLYPVILLLGVGSAVLLVEGPRRAWQGNFVWGAGGSVLVSLPLLLRFLAETPPGALKVLALSLFALQLWRGSVDFIVFVSA